MRPPPTPTVPTEGTAERPAGTAAREDDQADAGAEPPRFEPTTPAEPAFAPPPSS